MINKLGAAAITFAIMSLAGANRASSAWLTDSQRGSCMSQYQSCYLESDYSVAHYSCSDFRRCTETDFAALDAVPWTETIYYLQPGCISADGYPNGRVFVYPNDTWDSSSGYQVCIIDGIF